MLRLPRERALIDALQHPMGKARWRSRLDEIATTLATRDSRQWMQPRRLLFRPVRAGSRSLTSRGGARRPRTRVHRLAWTRMHSRDGISSSEPPVVESPGETQARTRSAENGRPPSGQRRRLTARLGRIAWSGEFGFAWQGATLRRRRRAGAHAQLGGHTRHSDG